MTGSVETLAEWLEGAVVSLHSRFIPGYGPLTGGQNGSAPRTFEARLRLLVERHYVDALRIGGHHADVWLDYSDDSEAPLDTLRPAALVVARQGCREPVVIGLGWPARGLKTLRLRPSGCASNKSVTILLSASDAGEALTTALSQMVAAAVVALGGPYAVEAA